MSVLAKLRLGLAVQHGRSCYGLRTVNWFLCGGGGGWGVVVWGVDDCLFSAMNSSETDYNINYPHNVFLILSLLPPPFPPPLLWSVYFIFLRMFCPRGPVFSQEMKTKTSEDLSVNERFSVTDGSILFRIKSPTMKNEKKKKKKWKTKTKNNNNKTKQQTTTTKTRKKKKKKLPRILFWTHISFIFS